MNNSAEKESFYFEKCTSTSDNFITALSILDNYKNTLSAFEYTIIKAKINTHYNYKAPVVVFEQELTQKEKLIVKQLGFFDKELVYSSKIKPDGTLAIVISHCPLNYSIIIKHLYDIKFNIFDHEIYMNNLPMTTNDEFEIQFKLSSLLYGHNAKIQDVKMAIHVIAYKNKFNSLKDYFEKLPKVKTNHLDNWIVKITGCEDNLLNRTMGRKWLISAVARAINPGCEIEGTLIFTGEQGAGKSTFFKTINPIEKYYCGSKVNIANPQTAAQTYHGKFIIEFSELSNLGKMTNEDIKQYLTNSIDTYVPKYENIKVDVPRMYIFGGTTNKESILSDNTGSRRYWIIKTAAHMDNELLKEIKNELWSEAYQAYLAGEIWYLNESERNLLNESNKEFEIDEPNTEYLREELSKYNENEDFAAHQLLTMLQSFNKKANSYNVAETMKSLGWSKKRTKTGQVYTRGAL